MLQEWLASRWVAVVCALLPVGVALPAEGAALTPALDGAFRRYVSLPDALLPVLESAKDRKSADHAAADLQALLPRVYEARQELRSIQALTPQQQQTVRERYESAMRSRWGKVFDHIYRLQRSHCYESVEFFKHFSTLCVMLEK